jgi:RNA recognition motif-containing protein
MQGPFNDTVYVGDLPKDLSYQELYQFFQEKLGVSCNIKMLK